MYDPGVRTKLVYNIYADAIVKLNNSFHGLMSRFSSCNTTTKNKLFHQYCSSMYGSQLWLLSKSEKMCSKWRKYHRIVLGVGNTTHCDLLPLIADNMPLDCILDLKYLSFYRSIMSSENRVIKYTAHMMSKFHTSTLCKNVKHLRYKYDISVENITKFSKCKLKKHCYSKWLSQVDVSYPSYASIIRDMVLMTEDRCTRIFSNDECKRFIDFLCTI